MSATRPVLRVERLTKSFGGVRALDDVDLDVRAGEVHALLGQNGSGKSTLIKCVTGFHHPDTDALIEINGHRLHRPLKAGEFRDLGVSVVHQDLGLVPSLSVAENLRIGHLATTKTAFIRWRKEREIARTLLGTFGLAVEPTWPVEVLKPVERAILAIVRSLDELRRWPGRGGRGGGLLILDEATAFLDRQGKERVMEAAQQVSVTGAGVLMVTHDLKEALAWADRITVLRDGRRAATVDRENSTLESLVETLTGLEYGAVLVPGRDRERPQAEDTRAASEPTVVVRGARSASLAPFDLAARRGEIIGITGVVGSGWEDVPQVLYGVGGASGGTLTLAGMTVPLTELTPALAIGNGIAFVPADRVNEATIPDLSVRANVSLPVLDRYFKRGFLRTRTMTRDMAGVLREYRVVPPDPPRLLESLSGGNQQKVVLAKWLNLRTPLLLLAEPTQGVDVGARAELVRLIDAAAAGGTTVLYASADFAEVARVSDRVIVMTDGRAVSELSGTDLTEDRIAVVAFGGLAGSESHDDDGDRR